MLRDRSDVLYVELRGWSTDDDFDDDAQCDADLESQRRSDEIETAWEMEDEIHDGLAELHRKMLRMEIDALKAELDNDESLWRSPFDIALDRAECASDGAPSPVVSRFRRFMRDDGQRESFRRAACNRLRFKSWDDRKLEKRVPGFRDSVGLSRDWKRHRRHQAREQMFPRFRKEDLMAA